MFITNNSKSPIGVDGVIILRPKEENRFVSDDDEDIMARVRRLEKAGLISVSTEAGLVKDGVEVVETSPTANSVLNEIPSQDVEVEAPQSPKTTQRTTSKKLGGKQ